MKPLLGPQPFTYFKKTTFESIKEVPAFTSKKKTLEILTKTSSAYSQITQ